MNLNASVEQRTVERQAQPLAPMAAILFLSLLLTGTAFWYHRHVSSELQALPAQERAALYERTLATLRNTCAHVEGEELRGYCQEQARFVSLFAECDAACQNTCQRYFPRPTK